jgi:DNA replication protein DnaC
MGSGTHPAYWLSIVGSSGTGKTMLARMITNVFLRYIEGLRDENRGTPGDRYSRMGGFISWSHCVERMLEGDYGFTRQCKEDWFLALDDVGAENEKLRELGTSKLFAILNERQHKFTVLTCNYGLAEIAQRMDPRIASRLIRHGGVVVDSTGVKDYSLG